MANKKSICRMHDDIMGFCSMIEDLDFKQSKMLRRRVMSLVKKIEKTTIKAKQSGQSMEDRLSEYYDSTTSLGFVRKK